MVPQCSNTADYPLQSFLYCLKFEKNVCFFVCCKNAECGCHLDDVLPWDGAVVVHVFRPQAFPEPIDLKFRASLDGHLQFKNQLGLVPVDESGLPLQAWPSVQNGNGVKKIVGAKTFSVNDTQHKNNHRLELPFWVLLCWVSLCRDWIRGQCYKTFYVRNLRIFILS